jgi:hypothetical protein
MLFIFRDMWGTHVDAFTMENVGSFNPDGYGDRGVYFDRSGLKPRMFQIFPDEHLPKKNVELSNKLVKGDIGSDPVSDKEISCTEVVSDGAFFASR